MTRRELLIPKQLAEELLAAVSGVFVDLKSGRFGAVGDRLLPPVLSEIDQVINFGGIPLDLLRAGNRRTASTPAEASAALESGWTVQLQNAERHSLFFAQLCSRLGLDLSQASVRVNVYVTPAGREAAFGKHHDVVHALVLQVIGRKRWRVWDPAVDDPVWRMRRATHAAVLADDEPKIDTILSSGDVLFVRRGDPHEVTPTEESDSSDRSVHLTIGISSSTGHDLVRAVADEMGNDVSFRRASPLSHDRGGRVAWADSVRQAAIEWWRTVDAESLLALLDRVRAVRELPQPGIVAQKRHDSISTETTWWAVNPLVTILHDPGNNSLLVSGREVRGVSEAVAEALVAGIKDGSPGITARTLAEVSGIETEKALKLLSALADLGVLIGDAEAAN